MARPPCLPYPPYLPHLPYPPYPAATDQADWYWSCTHSPRLCEKEDGVQVRRAAMLVAICVLLPAVARAQDFGVMESAETINEGNFKLKANPMILLGRDGSETVAGVAITGGYGLTRTFDVEGKFAFYEDFMAFGGDVEYQLLSVRRKSPLDLSVGGGFHIENAEFDLNDSRAFDVTVIGSREIYPQLELYGALDLAFNQFTDDFFDGVDDAGYKTVHIVPGVEYRIYDNLDLLVEFGIGVNDDARHYFSAGLAYYLR
jgi:hypothetical protein